MTVVMGLALAALCALTACTSGSGGSGGGSSAVGAAGPSTTSRPSTPAASTSTSSGPAPVAVITTAPTAKSKVNPAAPVTVAVAGGRLTSVKLVNPAGKVVTGTLASDGSSWKSTEALGYSKTYSLSAKAVNADGKVASKQAKFTTLTPGNMTMPYFQSIGGYAITKGDTYGVAMVPIVHFDEPITDRAAAQKALKVTTSPHVDGVWYWADDQNVHFRPKAYWPAHTKVSISADVYGVRVGSGLYGESDVTTSFTIGRFQKTVADDNAPKVDKVRVYNAAGKVLRTMNTSMGQHSGETLPNGTYINFYTLDGNYTVIAHENPAHMSSQSYGLPAGDPHGYGTLLVPYSTKISIDGIYLHEFNSTIADQDSGRDVSEGCLNLRTADAVWFFDHSITGDPVVVNGAKGAPTIALWEGGDWSVPWKTWVAGSAVH